MNMTGTPPTDDESDDKIEPLDAADLLDEDGRVDTAKVKARANRVGATAARIDDASCYDLRQAARREDVSTVSDFAAEFAADPETIRYHVRGACSCSPTIDPVPEIIDAPVSAATCRDMRTFAAAVDGDLRSVGPIMDEFGVAKCTAARHIGGRCSHDHDTPTLTHDGYRWTVDEPSETETGGDPA